jgi:Rieske Fe-S protein
MRMSVDELSTGTGPTRRVVLAGAGAAAIAVAALAGCATYDQTAGTTPPAGGTGGGGTGDSGGDGGGGGTTGALAKTTDIPVGGGVVLDQRNIVITQPQAGTFKAFTATCTHQGCQVVEVKNGTINCPCHGSRFKIADGSVANGPATRALREIGITVSGTDIQQG